jgi:hypothetical protein
MWSVLQSLDHTQAYISTVLNRHKRSTTLIISRCEPPARSHINIIIFIIMVFSLSKNRGEKNKDKTCLSWMMKPSFDFYWGLSITKHLEIDLLILVGYHSEISGIQVIMQQQFRATTTYLMHISQDLRCNKVFVKQRRVYAPGLAFIAEEFSFHRRITGVKLDINTTSGLNLLRRLINTNLLTHVCTTRR